MLKFVIAVDDLLLPSKAIGTRLRQAGYGLGDFDLLPTKAYVSRGTEDEATVKSYVLAHIAQDQSLGIRPARFYLGVAAGVCDLPRTSGLILPTRLELGVALRHNGSLVETGAYTLNKAQLGYQFETGLCATQHSQELLDTIVVWIRGLLSGEVERRIVKE